MGIGASPRWTPEHTKLRNVLAALYWEKKEARRVVLEATLDPLRIGFSDAPVMTWHSIIEQAENQGKLAALIAKAVEENPNDAALVAAKEGRLSAILMPEIRQETWRAPTDQGTLEKLTSRASVLRPISFLERGLIRARSVCRIVLPGGSGTGFLIDDNLIVTNHHVLPTAAVASGAKVQFNYQRTVEGLDADLDEYELAPERGFSTSPIFEKGGNDWTVVRLREKPGGDPHDKWGAVPLVRLPNGEPRQGDEAVIIQHPGGQQKQVAMTHNVIAYADQRVVQYLTDTLEGSSGAAVFDVDWRVIAIHHAGGWLREPNTKLSVFRNEGIHVNVLIDGIDAARRDKLI